MGDEKTSRQNEAAQRRAADVEGGDMRHRARRNGIVGRSIPLIRMGSGPLLIDSIGSIPLMAKFETGRPLWVYVPAELAVPGLEPQGAAALITMLWQEWRPHETRKEFAEIFGDFSILGAEERVASREATDNYIRYLLKDEMDTSEGLSVDWWPEWLGPPVPEEDRDIWSFRRARENTRDYRTGGSRRSRKNTEEMENLYGRGWDRGTRRSKSEAPAEEKGALWDDVYDPREEQLRAQRQAIYETSLSREYGSPFRDARGKRLDAKIIKKEGPENLRPFIQRRMFAMGTGVQQRDGRLVPGTQTPTRKTVLESKKRYADADKVLRNRQDYEESLGIARKGGFYRVTQEATKGGFPYAVWPLPPGQRVPNLFSDESAAIDEARRLNGTRDPIYTGKWWVPPKKKYTKRELADWLPPADIWR